MKLTAETTIFNDDKVQQKFSELIVDADGIRTEVSKKVGNNEVISRINQSAESVKIQADKVNIEGAAIFTSSGRLSETSLDNAYDAKGAASTAESNAKDYADGAASTAESNAKDYADGAVADKADQSDAVARTQRIYYRKTASGAPSPNTTWLAASGTGYGNWSLKVPPMTSGTTKYPYLYTAVQTQTVAQMATGNSCSCSAVLLDDTTTVIDGGTIITGTVNANAVNASSGTFNTANIPNLSSEKITVGSQSLTAALNGKAASGAENTANHYITDVTSTDGIRVHDSHTSNNSIVINSFGMEVFKGGTTDEYSVAKYGDTARIGKDANNTSHVSILDNGMHIWAGAEITASNEVASFTGSVIELGKNAATSTIKLCGGKGVISYIDSLYFNISVANNTDQIRIADKDDRQLITVGNTQVTLTSEDDSGNQAWLTVNGGEDYGGYSTVAIDCDYLQMTGNSGVASTFWLMDPTVPPAGSQTYYAIWHKSSSDNYGLYRPPSSSRRYKEDIMPVQSNRLDPHRLYDIDVVQFKFKEGYFPQDDPYEQNRVDVVGFIAEDVYEHYPQAAIIIDDEVDNWDERYIIPPMLKLIQEQNDRITELERRLS